MNLILDHTKWRLVCFHYFGPRATPFGPSTQTISPESSAIEAKKMDIKWMQTSDPSILKQKF